MNAVKRQRPNISPDDIQRLLFHLEDTRNYVVKYGAAQDFNSAERETSDKAMLAIDELAGQITGDKEYLWQVSASAGGSDLEFQRGKEKQARRRQLMGVHFPLRAITFHGKRAN